MKNFISTNRVFILLYLAFAIVGGWLLLKFEKGDEIIYFNALHTPFFDSAFKWITMLAEWPLAILILLVVLFSGYGKGILLILNTVIVSLLVALLKGYVFAGEARPAIFFDGKLHLNFVTGVSILHNNSFPSGHTTIAFAIFFMLSIFSHNKTYSIVYFTLALLVGISRVYLLQHFFRDVYFGALLGMCVTGILWLTLAQSKFYNNIKWKDKALFSAN